MFRKVVGSQTSVSRIGNAVRRCATTTSGKDVSQKRDVVGIVFFSGICIVASALGTWQVKRYIWKVDLINTIKSSAAGPAATIEACTSQAEFADKATQMKGQVVRMRGKFAYDKELYLGLRSAPQSLTGGPAQGMASNPQGYYIITPFTRDDGCVVYVNRGWVPRNMYTQVFGSNTAGAAAAKAPTTQQTVPWDRPQGVVEIQVAMSAPEKAGTFSPVNATNSNILLWLEPAALLRDSIHATGTAASNSSNKQDEVEGIVVAEAVVVSPDTEQGFPYAKSVQMLQEQSVAPETHFVYAFTWFTLAAAGFYMTYLKFRRGGSGVASIKQKIAKSSTSK